MLHKKPDKEIIQDNTNQYEQEITKKLYTSMKVRIRKHDMTHQHKTGRETNKKRDDKCRDMRFKGNEAKVKYFLI